MDRSLGTLLRALQTSSRPEELDGLLNSSMSLLVLLTNHRNVTLLVSHLLTSPALWSNADVRSSLRVLTVFHNAAGHILQRDTQTESSRRDQFQQTEGLSREEWIRAVVKGADDQSPRWKHLLVLGGVLTGFEAHQRRGLSFSMKEHMEEAIVTATNLALENVRDTEPGMDGLSIIMVLSHVFDLLRPMERQDLDVTRLLPILIQAVFLSREGLNCGYFLGAIDADIVQTGSRFTWSEKSSSFYQTQRMATGPLVSALGVLSRITAFCIEQVPDGNIMFKVVEDLSTYSRTLAKQWQQNKLSELDISEEEQFLAPEALQKTLPLLWQVLKSSMFATVIIQSGLISRALRDRHIPVAQIPFIAVQTLSTLRNFYFVSSRIGHSSFSQFNFVYTAAIDMLAQHPRQAEAFLREIRPHEFGKISNHPHERCLDLFYLNTVEHFTLILPQDFCEQFLLQAAEAYLGNSGDQRLNEIFEAAHSVYLAVFSAPRNYELTSRHIPRYINVLFSVFPHQLSARQFRLAIRTLVRVSSPPFRLAQTQPLLVSTLLELVRYRAVTDASNAPLPALPSQDATEQMPMSEQSALVLATIDSLPYLSPSHLEEWLPLTAEALNSIEDQMLRETCKRRFWDILSNGEMDVPRAEFCVRWWNTMGGRQAVLFGEQPVTTIPDGGPYMSGALGETPKL